MVGKLIGFIVIALLVAIIAMVVCVDITGSIMALCIVITLTIYTLTIGKI